jgi:hypothetical protein
MRSTNVHLMDETCEKTWKQEVGMPVVSPNSVDVNVLRQVHLFHLSNLFEVLCSPTTGKSIQSLESQVEPIYCKSRLLISYVVQGCDE